MSKEQLQQLWHKLEDAMPYHPGEYELNFRYMFGGMGTYVRGRIFGVLVGEDIALKLPPAAQAELLQEEGARYWQVGGESPSKHYVIVPLAMQNDPQQLGRWMQTSIDYVLTLPRKK